MKPTEIKHMWCNVCKAFTPHFIQLVGGNADKTVSIKTSCSISDPVILRNEIRVPVGMYKEIMSDTLKPEQ